MLKLNLVFRTFCGTVFMALLAPLNLSASELDLKEIIRSIETQHLSATSRAKTRMRVQRRNYQREMELVMYGQGRERFIARVTQPAKDRGTTSLKLDGEMWNYLPNIDRVIKVPSHMMGDAWMGSHFTNDDLVKGNRVEELFSLGLLQQTTDLAVIEARAKDNAAVVWGRIEYHLQLPQKVAFKVLYYDEDEVLVRQLEFSEFQTRGERLIPMRLVMTPEGGDGESTQVDYLELDLDAKVEPRVFSLQGLKRRDF